MQVADTNRALPATIVGHTVGVHLGDEVLASGQWVEDHRFGHQFRAAFLKVVPPRSRKGIEKYLASGIVKGIGPKHAKKLFDAFGSDVFEIIEKEPSRLRSVPGIGPSLQARIERGWKGKAALRDTMLFLHECGIGPSRARQIYDSYGPQAVQIVREDPYRLVGDVGGIGFATADSLAIGMGASKSAPLRVRAGIRHALARAADAGHCGLPIEVLRPEVVRLLEVPESVVEQAMAEETRTARVVEGVSHGQRCAFPAELYRAEKSIADRIKALAAGRPPWSPIDRDTVFTWLIRELKLDLADEQRSAVELALESKVLVITGGPGVGKTTLMNAILTALRAHDVTIELAASTGRAAKRLSDTTGMHAKTIHRLLVMDPKTGRFRRDETAPLECDLLVVDEVSMVDVPLMNAVVRALPDEGGLFLVGDVDQLPSVGPGQVLADLIDGATIPVGRLTKVFRQPEVSRIAVNAHLINQGKMPELDAASGDFYFVEARDSNEGVDKIIEIVRNRIPGRFGLDPIRDVQVISPMSRGVLGVRNLNRVLQRELNPDHDSAIERPGCLFRTGDKVMQTKNNYDWDVYNGDIGFISGIDDERGTVRVVYDGRPQAYDADDLDQLVHAYAITVHKSQGSEYAAVVMVLCGEHYPMLRRNLLYTGVTRGRRLVVIVGQAAALAMAVKGRGDNRRWSTLRHWLESGRG